jgi:hypothetical protein
VDERIGQEEQRLAKGIVGSHIIAVIIVMQIQSYVPPCILVGELLAAWAEALSLRHNKYLGLPVRGIYQR